MIKIIFVFVFLLCSELSLAGEPAPCQNPPGGSFASLVAWTTRNGCGKIIGIHFDYNSAELKSSEIRRLVNWNIESRLNCPNRFLLGITGIADVGEKNAQILSKKRARAVIDFLWNIDHSKVGIIVGHHVYDMPRLDDQVFTRTEIMMVLPGPECSI